MLPEFLVDSYRRYKADTTRLSTWLAVTSEGCGYIPTTAGSTQPPSTRLKGRARNEAKASAMGSSGAIPTARYVLDIKDFVPRAHVIASFHKPPVKAPLAVQIAAEEVVSARKRCASYFRTKATKDHLCKKDSDESHSYFIQILEEILHILRPCFVLSKVDGPTQHALNEGNSRNMFDGLAIEEIEGVSKGKSSAEDTDDLAVPPVSSAKSKKDADKDAESKEIKDAPTYDIAVSDEEKHFAVFCLLEDFGHIRNFIRETWAKYKDGLIDLMAAAVTVNTAIELARRAGEDFASKFPQFSDYEAILEFSFPFVPEMRKLQVIDPAILNNYDALDQIYFHPYGVLKEFRDAQARVTGQTAVIRPIRGCTYSPVGNWSSLSILEKQQVDLVLLRDMMPQLTIFLGASLQQRESVPTEDELLKGLRGMLATKKIPISLVFALQVFLDTHHIFGMEIGRPFWDYRVAGNKMVVALKDFLQYSATYAENVWDGRNNKIIQRLIKNIERWTTTDVLLEWREIQDMKHRGASPSSEEWPKKRYHLLSNYPCLCGLYLLSAFLSFQEAGLSLFKSTGWVQHAAHLYNAVEKENFLSVPWPDMDHLISIQSAKDIFIGEPPTTRDSYYKRLCLMDGLSLEMFATNRRDQKKRALSKRGTRGFDVDPPIPTLLRQRYSTGQDGTETKFKAEHVEALLRDKIRNELKEMQEGGSLLTARWDKYRRLSPLEMLECLRYFVEKECHRLRFNYFAMQEQCTSLLTKIYAAIDSDLQDQAKIIGYKANDKKDNSTLSRPLLYFLFRSLERPDQTSGTALLGKAASILQDFVLERGDSHETQWLGARATPDDVLVLNQLLCEMFLQ